jgi:predicted butyrate kinase (DUF1464 family)
VELSDIFGIEHLEKNRNELLRNVHFLEDDTRVSDRVFFEGCVERIKTYFSNVKEELTKKISVLNDDEIERLNEAIHCFLACMHLSCPFLQNF